MCTQLLQKFVIFTVTSLNVRGIQNARKRRSIFNFYRNMSDILLLQETHSSANCEFQWTAEWGGRALFSHGSTNSAGVCILFKKSFFCNITNILKDVHGRMIMCKIETESGFATTICNIYAPNTDSPAFFDALDQNLADAHWNKIVMGDFNLVLDTTKDRFQSNHNNSNAQKRLTVLMEEYELTDIWRLRNPHDIYYSWKSYANQRASRIDFCLLPTSVAQLCENVTYMQGICTDHCAMFLSMQDLIHKRGPGLLES